MPSKRSPTLLALLSLSVCAAGQSASLIPPTSSAPPAASAPSPTLISPPNSSPAALPTSAAVISGSTVPKVVTIGSAATSTITCTSTPSPRPPPSGPLASLYPVPPGGYGWLKDGDPYGCVYIHNNCKGSLYVTSVGAWKLGGPRDTDNPDPTKREGLGSPCDDQMTQLEPGGTWAEPYRVTCPKGLKKNDNDTKIYCANEDKVAGQGISVKIASTPGSNNIFQFEYALLQDPARGESGDKFRRLNYDVSLLDCAAPTDCRNITDVCATPEEQERKAAGCPGYQEGLAVWLDTWEKAFAAKCPPMYCTGKQTCMDIYTWDRTRIDEASVACDAEFKGDLHVDLCVGNKGSAANADIATKYSSYKSSVPKPTTAASTKPSCATPHPLVTPFANDPPCTPKPSTATTPAGPAATPPVGTQSTPVAAHKRNARSTFSG